MFQVGQRGTQNRTVLTSEAANTDKIPLLVDMLLWIRVVGISTAEGPLIISGIVENAIGSERRYVAVSERSQVRFPITRISFRIVPNETPTSISAVGVPPGE